MSTACGGVGQSCGRYKLPPRAQGDSQEKDAGHLKHLGRLGRGREHFCLVCSAASRSFGAVRTLSDLIQHAKSEGVGCRTSEPLDSLIGSVLANERGVLEGRK